jgi:transcriptional regulator with XRE-family HTH domain
MIKKELELGKIKDILKAKNISISAFSKQLEITDVGLHKIIRTNTTTESTLNKIADLLDVPVSNFYADGGGKSINKKRRDASTINDGIHEKLVELEKKVAKLNQQNTSLQSDVMILREAVKNKDELLQEKEKLLQTKDELLQAKDSIITLLEQQQKTSTTAPERGVVGRKENATKSRRLTPEPAD